MIQPPRSITGVKNKPKQNPIPSHQTISFINRANSMNSLLITRSLFLILSEFTNRLFQAPIKITKKNKKKSLIKVNLIILFLGLGGLFGVIWIVIKAYEYFMI